MPKLISPLEVIDKQNEIIKQQSDIIDSLYLLLMQHMTVEEACRTQVYTDMKYVSGKIDEIV